MRMSYRQESSAQPVKIISFFVVFHASIHSSWNSTMNALILTFPLCLLISFHSEAVAVCPNGHMWGM
jgi:hypothetical protein